MLKQRTQQILNYSSLGFPYWVPHSTSPHRPGPKDDGSVSLRRASSLARPFISSSSPLLFSSSSSLGKKRQFKAMPLEDTAADRSFGVTVVLVAIHLDKIVTRSAGTHCLRAVGFKPSRRLPQGVAIVPDWSALWPLFAVFDPTDQEQK